MSVSDIIANGGVIPDGEQTPKPSEEQNGSSSPTPEEISLQEAEQKKANMLKALEQVNSEYESLREQLRTKRPELKELKKQVQSEDDGDEQYDFRQHVDSIVQNELEQLRAEPRKQAFQQFFSSHDDLVDDTLRREVLRRYELLKTSNEISVDGVIADLNAAYYSIKGQEIFRAQDRVESQERLFMAGTRSGGAPSNVSQNKWNPSQSEMRAMEDLSKLTGEPLSTIVEKHRKRAERTTN